MVSQISYTPNSRAFQEFSQPKSGYYLPAPISEEEKKKKSHTFGMTIAVSALVVGFGTLALMKGFVPKGLTKHLDKWKKILENKLNKDGKLGTFSKKALDLLTSWGERTKGINNINSLKDVLFERLMCGKDGKRPITSKIHKGITKFFHKLSRNTVNHSYSKTQKQFSVLNEILADINKKVVSTNPSQKAAIHKLENLIKNMNSSYEEGFGLNARTGRLRELQSALSNLFSEFWGKSFNGSFKDIVRNFKQKDMYQSFIAESVMQPAKDKLIESTMKNKDAVKVITDKILKEYENILSPNELSKVKRGLKSALKSLDSSIEVETGKYFDKARDMKLGSAPTDVLSILSGLGSVGWFAAQSKDKDERISAVLKYGVPAVGTIATSLYCNAKLITGGKGIIFSALSGLMMNKIGGAIDDLRKKYSLDISFQNKMLLKPQSDTV